MGWYSVVWTTVQTMLVQVVGMLKSLIKLSIILLIGWIVARAVRWAVLRIGKSLPVDKWADQAGITKFLTRGGITLSVMELIAGLVYWVLLLVFVTATFDALGLATAADILKRVIAYVPDVVTAIFILFLGGFFANVLATTVRTAASNAGVAKVNLLGQITQWAVLIFAFAAAMEQLRIAQGVIGFAFNIVLASIGLGIALAFGLGCKDIAGRTVHDLLDKIRRG
ncbi:MAG: hypothetical protein HY597_02540 [Candidatus Omnitrophica bacterium]|nr:hypothetical protein [Candidatus Omnitrophota bacterium]